MLQGAAKTSFRPAPTSPTTGPCDAHADSQSVLRQLARERDRLVGHDAPPTSRVDYAISGLTTAEGGTASLNSIFPAMAPASASASNLQRYSRYVGITRTSRDWRAAPGDPTGAAEGQATMVNGDGVLAAPATVAALSCHLVRYKPTLAAATPASVMGSVRSAVAAHAAYCLDGETNRQLRAEVAGVGARAPRSAPSYVEPCASIQLPLVAFTEETAAVLHCSRRAADPPQGVPPAGLVLGKPQVVRMARGEGGQTAAIEPGAQGGDAYLLAVAFTAWSFELAAPAVASDKEGCPPAADGAPSAGSGSDLTLGMGVPELVGTWLEYSLLELGPQPAEGPASSKMQAVGGAATLRRVHAAAYSQLVALSAATVRAMRFRPPATASDATAPNSQHTPSHVSAQPLPPSFRSPPAAAAPTAAPSETPHQQPLPVLATELYSWGHPQKSAALLGRVVAASAPAAAGESPSGEGGVATDALAAAQDLSAPPGGASGGGPTSATEPGLVNSCSSPSASPLGPWRVLCVSCSWFHCVAATDIGTVYSWGSGADGALGHGDESALLYPRMLDFFGLQHPLFATGIAAGADASGCHTLVVARGRLSEEMRAETGGSGAPLGAPGPAVGPGAAAAAACGRVFAFGLRTATGVTTLPPRAQGQQGVWRPSPPPTTASSVCSPVLVCPAAGCDMYDPEQGGVVEVAAGGGFSLARTQAGALYAWGKGVGGRLGIGLVTPGGALVVPGTRPVRGTGKPAPTPVAVASDPTDPASSPMPAAPDTTAAQQRPEQAEEGDLDGDAPAEFGSPTASARTPSGGPLQPPRWSLGPYRVPLGQDDPLLAAEGAKPSPFVVPNTAGQPTLFVSRMAAGEAHGCAIDGAGRLWAWGRGDSGQLGLGSLQSAVAPLMLPPCFYPSDAPELLLPYAPYPDPGGAAAVQFVSVACGVSHSLGVDARGGVWTWGGCGGSMLGHGQPPAVLLTDGLAAGPPAVGAGAGAERAAAPLPPLLTRLVTLAALDSGVELDDGAEGAAGGGPSGGGSAATPAAPPASHPPSCAREWLDLAAGLGIPLRVVTEGEQPPRRRRAAAAAFLRMFPWTRPRRFPEFGLLASEGPASAASVRCPRVVSVSAGAAHSVAVTADGMLFSWGRVGLDWPPSAGPVSRRVPSNGWTERWGLGDASSPADPGAGELDAGEEREDCRPSLVSMLRRAPGGGAAGAGRNNGVPDPAPGNSSTTACDPLPVVVTAACGAFSTLAVTAGALSTPLGGASLAGACGHLVAAAGVARPPPPGSSSPPERLQAAAASALSRPVARFDLLLRVQGAELTAHRALLCARSPVLAGLVWDACAGQLGEGPAVEGTAESGSGSGVGGSPAPSPLGPDHRSHAPAAPLLALPLRDVSLPVARLLLEFLYTDGIVRPPRPGSAEGARTLAALRLAADRYAVPRLAAWCTLCLDAPVARWVRKNNAGGVGAEEAGGLGAALAGAEEEEEEEEGEGESEATEGPQGASQPHAAGTGSAGGCSAQPNEKGRSSGPDCRLWTLSRASRTLFSEATSLDVCAALAQLWESRSSREQRMRSRAATGPASAAAASSSGPSPPSCHVCRAELLPRAAEPTHPSNNSLCRECSCDGSVLCLVGGEGSFALHRVHAVVLLPRCRYAYEQCAGRGATDPLASPSDSLTLPPGLSPLCVARALRFIYTGAAGAAPRSAQEAAAECDRAGVELLRGVGREGRGEGQQLLPPLLQLAADLQAADLLLLPSYAEALQTLLLTALARPLTLLQRHHRSDPGQGGAGEGALVAANSAALEDGLVRTALGLLSTERRAAVEARTRATGTAPPQGLAATLARYPRVRRALLDFLVLRLDRVLPLLGAAVGGAAAPLSGGGRSVGPARSAPTVAAELVLAAMHRDAPGVVLASKSQLSRCGVLVAVSASSASAAGRRDVTARRSLPLLLADAALMQGAGAAPAPADADAGAGLAPGGADEGSAGGMRGLLRSLLRAVTSASAAAVSRLVAGVPVWMLGALALLLLVYVVVEALPAAPVLFSGTAGRMLVPLVNCLALAAVAAAVWYRVPASEKKSAQHRQAAAAAGSAGR